MKLDGAHPDLLRAQEVAYTPAGLVLNNFSLERESQEYGACRFQLNNHRIVFRIAKITPTKIGQFVTIWKRQGDGPIMPFDFEDPVDFFIVSVRSERKLGQFVFPKDALLKQGFVSKEGKGGKRAMRVYPPWDVPDNEQAKRTQRWQLNYFYEIEPHVGMGQCKTLLIG